MSTENEPQKLCPACGSPMDCGLRDLPIGADGGGGLFPLLLYEQYSVDLYVCPRCGKIELYSSQFRSAQEENEAPGEPDVICPVCGNAHSPLVNCPVCVLRAARSGRRIPNADGPEGPKPGKSRKPPWEK